MKWDFFGLRNLKREGIEIGIGIRLRARWALSWMTKRLVGGRVIPYTWFFSLITTKLELIAGAQWFYIHSDCKLVLFEYFSYGSHNYYLMFVSKTRSIGKIWNLSEPYYLLSYGGYGWVAIVKSLQIKRFQLSRCLHKWWLYIIY